ncbi:MAG: hypothetical protein KJ674_04415 [Nanoarchaeota archaeon]|nr:hypothetical protein [Nanoarchaeota archaeon]
MKIKIKNKIIIFFLVFTIIPFVSADITVIDENGQQSATINIQPYQIGVNNYADITIIGTGDYEGDEIFIKQMQYSPQIQIATGDIGLGRYSETIPEPYICLEGDLECELRKQNRNNITIYSDTDLFAFPDLQFDYATVKLKKYKDIDNLISCSDFNVNTFECNSNFQLGNIEFTSDDSFIYFNVTHFSGWVGASYFYANMEDSGVNLCTANGDGYRGRCNGNNLLVTNYKKNVYMDMESMKIDAYHTTSTDVFGFDAMQSGSRPTVKHYSRIYVYLSKEDLAGLSTIGSPLFSTMERTGTTTSCGFIFDEDSKEEITCMYDETSADYNPTEFGNKINITEWGLWDKWFTLEYYVDVNASAGGSNNCTCWVNGISIASVGNLDYDESLRFFVVGYPIDFENGMFNITYDEHRASDKYIGGYPDILTSWVKYNPVNPSYDQTIYANITDNEGVEDINFVYLTFNNTISLFNVPMYQLDNTNTWEANISSSNFTEGNNYTYTVRANDTNGQNAVPFNNTFLAGICNFEVYLLEPTTNLDINISDSFTMKACYNTTGTCVYPNWLYHQYYNNILWNLIPLEGNQLTSLVNNFYINTCPEESDTEVICTGTGEYEVRGNIDSNYSSTVNITCGTVDPNALEAIETGINNVIPSSIKYTKQQIYTVKLDNTQTIGTFDKVAILDNQTWGINYVNTTETYANVNSLPYNIVNILELDNITYYEIISNVEDFIISTL